MSSPPFPENVTAMSSCVDMHSSALAPWRLAVLAPTAIPGASFLGEPSFILVVAASFAFYSVIWCLCTDAICKGVIASWRLKLIKPAELRSMWLAAVNTFLVTPAAYYVMVSGESGLPVWQFHLAVCLGYFLLDLFTFCLPYGAHAYTGHHLLVLIGHFPAAAFRGECLNLVWISAACFVVETSNLFLIARILLGCSTSPRAKTPFTISSIGLLATFVPCRVLWLPVVFRELYVLEAFPVFYHGVGLLGAVGIWLGCVLFLATLFVREGKLFFTHTKKLAALRKDF